MVGRGMLALGFAASSLGCVGGTFLCESDAQCDGGTCEPSGGCSFDDPSCPSGRRYGAYAPAGLGGDCVPVDEGTDAAETSAGPGGPGSATSGPTTSASSTMTDASTTVPITATEGSTSTDPTLDTGEPSTGSSATSESTGTNPIEFLDEFDRPDGGALGNGWIEKTPAAFRLLDEQVELDTQNGLDFRNNLFYRPLSESMLDVEASMVVRFTTDDAWGYPQLHLRVQDDVDTPGSLNSYAVFVDSAEPTVPQLTVNRIDGPGFGPSMSIIIEPPPLDADLCRVRGRVTGTDPVVLEGFFEVWDGSDWVVRAEISLDDDEPERLVEAGTVGGGGHLELEYFVLDDFAYTDLGG